MDGIRPGHHKVQPIEKNIAIVPGANVIGNQRFTNPIRREAGEIAWTRMVYCRFQYSLL